MAQPTNTHSTYDQVGIREDLADIISRVEPEETPFSNNIGSRTVENTYASWQTQALAAASDSNAVIEGDDATTDAATATGRIGNYTQISDKVARVTGTARAVNTAGRADEMDYQVLLKGLELKRDVEKQMLSNNAAVAGDDSTARESAGMETMVDTNADHGTSGSTAAWTSGAATTAPTDGAQRALTETIFLDNHQAIWEAGGRASGFYCGGFNKRKFSAMTGIAETRLQSNGSMQAKIVGAADVYVGDFGNVYAIPSQFIRTRTALVIDHSMVKMGTVAGRNFSRTPLAKTGDSDREQILVEYTLCVENEKAHGKIADLTTS